MRQLRDGETSCKFGCKTIVTVVIASCEMCCEEAIAERNARLAPIKEAELKAAEEKTARVLARIAEKKAQLAEVEPIALDEKPKVRKGRS